MSVQLRWGGCFPAKLHRSEDAPRDLRFSLLISVLLDLSRDIREVRGIFVSACSHSRMHAARSTKDEKGDGRRRRRMSRSSSTQQSGRAPGRPALISEHKNHQRKRPRQPNPDSMLTVPGAVTSRSRRGLVVAITAAVAVAVLPRGAEAQYNADTPLFEENMEKAEAELLTSLKGGDYVEDVFFPERQVSTVNHFGPLATMSIRHPNECGARGLRRTTYSDCCSICMIQTVPSQSATGKYPAQQKMAFVHAAAIEFLDSPYHT